MVEKNFTVDSDALINALIKEGRLQKIGVGDRYDDEYAGLHSQKLQGDNTYNWELVAHDDEDITVFFHLSNDFEVRESDELVILSKHVGQDIRSGYEDDVIYLKEKDDSFAMMVHEYMHELAVEDKE